MSHAHDFDFLFGRWTVAHRRLRLRLANNHEWETFDGSCEVRPLMGGHGNVDDSVLNLPAGSYRGLALRSFDPASQRWSIWWLDSRHPHTIDVPVVGGFDQGVGTFYADEIIQGQSVRVRFRWSDTQTASPLWEQAFSADSGKTWEVNWQMRFVRTSG